MLDWLHVVYLKIGLGSLFVNIEIVLRQGLCLQTLGNTEFTKGIGGLKTFLDNIDFPVLGCNIDTTKEPSLNGRILANTVVLGGTVGIIGYTTAIVPNTVLKSECKKLRTCFI